MCHRLFFDKVARPDACKLIRRDSGTGVYLSILQNLLRTPFSQNASCRMLLFLLVCRSVFRTFSNILRKQFTDKNRYVFSQKTSYHRDLTEFRIRQWHGAITASQRCSEKLPFLKISKKSIKNICGGACRHKATAYFKK